MRPHPLEKTCVHTDRSTLGIGRHSTGLHCGTYVPLHPPSFVHVSSNDSHPTDGPGLLHLASLFHFHSREPTTFLFVWTTPSNELESTPAQYELRQNVLDRRCCHRCGTRRMERRGETSVKKKIRPNFPSNAASHVGQSVQRATSLFHFFVVVVVLVVVTFSAGFNMHPPKCGTFGWDFFGPTRMEQSSSANSRNFSVRYGAIIQYHTETFCS